MAKAKLPNTGAAPLAGDTTRNDPTTEYMATPLAVMSGELVGRAEQMGMTVPERSGPPGAEPPYTGYRQGIYGNQAMARGARLRLDANVHASMVDADQRLQTSSRIIPSSGAVHGNFSGGSASGRM